MRNLRPSALSRTLALVPPAVILVAQHATGAFSSFLKLDTITGDSIDSKHADWSDITGFSFGISPSTVSGGAGSSVPADLVITKKLDKGSPQLFLAGAARTTLATVTLELFTAGGTPSIFYRLTLNNVIVKKIDTAGTAAGTDQRPTESVSLTYSKIKIEYFYLNNSGTTTAAPIVTWNFATNTP